MRARAIKDLSQLSDEKLFSEVAKGMDLCLENAERLFAQSQELGKLNHPQGFNILRTIVEEEAGKFMILLDAIRCPRETLAKHLSKFNNHLARSLYAYSCDLKPGNYKELMHYLNLKRQQFYLDGPNDVDFIFRNEVLHSREAAIYVDYVETEDGHDWLNPYHWGGLEPFEVGFKPSVLELAIVIRAMGFVCLDVLRIVASKWRSIEMKNDYSYEQLSDEIWNTLKELGKNKLIKDTNKEHLRVVVEKWTFPLHAEELEKEIPVSREALREKQRNWNPDWY